MTDDTSRLAATTANELANMTVEERKALAGKINLLLKEIDKLNWADETCPQLLESVKKTIAKFGVSFHQKNDALVSDLEDCPLFDVNEICVCFDITARCDSDWRTDEETAEFDKYSDYVFSEKYSNNLPRQIDFWDVYRGDNIEWEQEGAMSSATYSVHLYAVTKKLDLEKLSTQNAVECFIMDEEDTKNWVYDCSVIRLDSGEFKL